EFTFVDTSGAASAGVSAVVEMPLVLPDSAPMRRFGGVAGRGGRVSSSPAMSPPLSRSERSCARSGCPVAQGTHYRYEVKLRSRKKRARARSLDSRRHPEAVTRYD